MDSLKLELFKNKQEHAQSAIASQEVREHLAGFIRSKRQGSANQINTIQLPHHLGSCGHGGAQGNIVGTSSYAYTVNLSNEINPDDDHPLRKTASMPTMHIPYKAQSLSRRRQMERRTTMSPLMRRKSKPKRQLLHSQDSSSTDYSSNPCIIQSTRATARSLSQSSSPPPSSLLTTNDTGVVDQQQQQQNLANPSNNVTISSIKTSTTATTSSLAAGTSQQSHDPSPSSSQAIKLSSIFTNRELENLQNNLKNSLYFSTAPHTTHKNNQSNSGSSGNLNNSNLNNNNNNEAQVDQNALRQQQHLRVNEAIRKTVIQRATNKERMAGGGSLDMEGTVGAGSISGEIGPKAGSSSGIFGDELRQWSLDGADLRTNALLNKLANTTSSGGLFSRDFNKLRLATTKDAAALRRSQSPSSSISMGLSSGQAAASVTQPPAHTGSNAINHITKPVTGLITNVNMKQYSSSSSSTSSLLSQQDSLEDSSSQAIDLSSSSEAGRRHQQSSMYVPVGAHRGQLVNHLLSCGSSAPTCGKPNQPYQKVLQESFNQLQLCHSQERMNQYVLPSQHSPSQHRTTVQRGESSNATCQHHPPPLLDASKAATSLDAATSRQHHHLLVSLSKQFNLSASAQNLISIPDHLQHNQHNLCQQLHLQQQQQPQAHNEPLFNQHNPQINPIIAHQQHDLNQLVLAYKNLIQSSPDTKQTNQISSALLTKINNLPEVYRSSLLSHLIQQQQDPRQQQQKYFREFCTAAEVGGDGTSIGRASIDQDSITSHAYPAYIHPIQGSSLDQRSLISRTLSSPLLASETSMNVDGTTMPVAYEQSDHMMCCERLNEHTPHLGPDVVHMNLEQTRIGSKLMSRDDSAIGMVVDSLDDKVIGDKTKSKQSSIAENSHSLDLTTSSRSTSESSGGTKSDPPLSFNYTPMNPTKASYNFIYNPVFDKNSSTGLIYDLGMCNHKCICGDENNHPENSYRILAIWKRLYDTGLMAKCARIESRRATIEEIQLCHSETYSYYFGKGPYERLRINQLDLSKLPIEGLTQLECGGQGADIDTAWNEEQTPGVARLAAGCVIEAAVNVANGKLMNAFAVVRPPGHHAEFQQAMGFCFFNSIAIAARILISKHNLVRILIVDWDVHHGNGIQKMFYDDKRVMYISLHRHDKGQFFPGTGFIKDIGVGSGEGYNWNIAWSGECMGDAEYLAAFRSLVMPIAIDYNPSMVLVACGFDAARGHPFNFGGYDLSPACFAHMTRQLMSLANGRLVLCLEGGYQLNTICDCAESCTRALLNESHLCPTDQMRESELRREPNQSATEVLFEVSSLAAKYWPSVERLRCKIDKSALEAANVR